MTVTLRDVTPEDRDFLRDVYATTRAAEMEMVPWSDEQKHAFLDFQFNAQDTYYREKFALAQYSVILLDQTPVGRLYVLRDDQEIRILDVTVLPEYRKRGIGSFLVTNLLEEAERSGKAVQIYIESFNPSRELFERMGFSAVAEEGINLLFEWKQKRGELASVSQ
jgi:ribosomal protein S18 acetylase RimI-like enzyme